MRALVTGGHGFIGSHIVDALLAKGHEVRAMASPWGKLHNLTSAQQQPGFEIVRGDITEPESLDPAFEGVELVVHAAARVADWGKWPLFQATNVDGTQNVVDAALRAKCRRLVHVSSVAVHEYSGFRDAEPRTHPRGGAGLVAYARSKVLAEELVEKARGQGLETVIARPGLWPFGPRDPQFHKFADAIRSGSPLLVRGGESVINTAYAENLAEGIALCGTVAEARDRLYLIADDGAPCWKEVLGYLAELIDAKLPGMRVPGWMSRMAGVSTQWWYATVKPGKEPPLTRYRGQVMINDVHFSIAAAREELGYDPQCDWREGLRRTVASGAAKAA